MEIKHKSIVRAKVHLQSQNPFFAYLIMYLKIVEDKTIESCAVDSKGTLYYNADWVKKLDSEELKGVLAHEVMHLVLEHLQRGKDKNHEIYNWAGDLVINCILNASNFRLPQGLVPYNNEFKFNEDCIIQNIDKKSADEIYNELMKKLKVEKKEKEKEKLFKQLKKQIESGRFDEHIFGDGKDKKKDDDKDKDKNGSQSDAEIKKKWKKIFGEASVYAKQQGKLPSEIERLVDIVLNDKISWKSILYKYITRELPYDYSYCLDKNTKIKTPRGECKIEDLKQGRYVLGYKNKKIVYSKIKSKFQSKIKEKYIIETIKGNKIICSEKHRILTKRGYVKASELNKRDIILGVKKLK